MLPLHNYAKLSQQEEITLQTFLTPLCSLSDVVHWALLQKPAYEISEVIVQDEFTHDIVIPWKDKLTLVFDTT